MLPGITRAVLVDCARELGIPVQQRLMSLDEARGAAELFITSTTREIVPIVTVDDRTLAITLKPGRSDVRVLAHPDLAISKPVADSAWPLGTRASRIVSDGEQKQSRARVLTITRDGQPSLRFIVSSGDPRDLLDGGADLMLTRDAAALDYARTLPHFQTIALAWQRTQYDVMNGFAKPS